MLSSANVQTKTQIDEANRDASLEAGNVCNPLTWRAFTSPVDPETERKYYDIRGGR